MTGGEEEGGRKRGGNDYSRRPSERVRSAELEGDPQALITPHPPPYPPHTNTKTHFLSPSPLSRATPLRPKPASTAVRRLALGSSQ